jgi:hypothetical protein
VHLLRERTLPENVSRLLRDHIDSFEKLEVLMLLQHHPQSVWNASSVSLRVGITPLAAAAALQGLHDAGLIAVRPGGQFSFEHAREDSELARAVEQLADRWGHDPVPLMRFMATTALDRLRSSAGRAFSQAFRTDSRSRKVKKG